MGRADLPAPINELVAGMPGQLASGTGKMEHGLPVATRSSLEEAGRNAVSIKRLEMDMHDHIHKETTSSSSTPAWGEAIGGAVAAIDTSGSGGSIISWSTLN